MAITRLPLRGAVLLLCLVLSPALAAEDLSLARAVDDALKNNPEIAAGDLSAQAAAHSARGARALANPEIVVAPTIAGEAGSDSALLFSQPLEINGARKVRGRIAAHEAGAASANAAALRREIVRDVKQAYWEVARAQELVRLNEENVWYLETLRGTVQKQLDAGAVPGAQLLKTDVELARARQELERARLELDTARNALNLLTGRPASADYAVAAPPASSNSDTDRDRLRATALASRPELASARAELDAAQSRVTAAALQRMPDLAVQARRESFSADSESGVAIALTLPVLDWGSVKSSRQAAESTARAQEKRLEAVKAQVALEVDQAIRRVEAASQVVREYEGGIIEKSEQLAQMARTGYEKGATSYLEVLEAQRTLRSTRADYYSALAERAKALAQLEWAAGRDLSTEADPEVKE